MGVLIGLALTIRLDSVPPAWWDEGWTLSVARNWVESGHYGRLSVGEPVPAGITQASYITGLVALSFWLFGVGIVQGRIVVVMITAATLLLMYYLVRRMYDQSIASGSLVVTMLLPAYIDLFPIYVGRQVLGEMPAMFFLLAGYMAMLSLPRYRLWALALAVLFWAFALITKLQVLPFWMCSLAVPTLVAVCRRDWKSSSFWVIALIGSLAGSHILTLFSERFLQTKSGVADPIRGLYEVTALVTSIPSRMFALMVVIMFGLPTLLGLCYGLLNITTNKLDWRFSDQVKIALLFLASSWFGWFLLFSVGWVRYMFPPVFVGSIFVACMIYDLTRGYDVTYTLQQSRAFFRGRGFNKEAAGALLVLLIVVTSVPRTGMALYKTYVIDADNSVQQTADFLNSQTAAATLIETYDSELMFLLNRPYQYPPDQLLVNLIRRTFLYEHNIDVDYDPLVANPDYLVVGPHSKQWRLYDPVVRAGAFRLLQSYKRYQIYERVR
jgi:4-amino-4-deoxy-L-arabinose transferase-like glycosyltransferase